MVAGAITALFVGIVLLVGFLVLNGSGHQSRIPVPALGAGYGALLGLSYKLGHTYLWRHLP
jgi:hypothetical protein